MFEGKNCSQKRLKTVKGLEIESQWAHVYPVQNLWCMMGNISELYTLPLKSLGSIMLFFDEINYYLYSVMTH